MGIMDNKPIDFYFTLHELEPVKGLFVHEAHFYTKGYVTDEGIGQYEFWGFHGVDRHYVFEPEEIIYTGTELKKEVDEWINSSWDTLCKIASETAESEGYIYEEQ